MSRFSFGMYLFFSLVFGFLAKGNAEYVFSSIEDKDMNTDYNEYEGLKIGGIEAYASKLDVVNYHDCIQECDATKTNCKSINIEKQSDKNYTCYYFSVSRGNFVKQSNMTYVSREEPQCSNYCRQMSYMDLCKKCRCVDKCNSKFSHYCDCTKALKEPKKDCVAVKAAGFTDPAMYNMNSGGGDFKGFCEQREDEKLWLAMARRFITTFADDKQLSQWINGFGNPHDETYWLGLKHMYHFTQQSNTILRVQVATYSHHYNWYGEYGTFKITKTDEVTFGYTVSNYRTNFCLWDQFEIQASTKPFGNCSPLFWFTDNCGNSPFSKNHIFWGMAKIQRLSLLLRHGTLPDPKVKDANPSSTQGIEISKGNQIGLLSYFARDFCVSFDLFTRIYYIGDVKRSILVFLFQGAAFHVFSGIGGKLCVTTLFANKNGLRTYINGFYKAPEQLTWVNLKISQMFMSSGDYQIRILVDNIEVGKLKTSNQVFDHTELSVYAGFKGLKAYDGHIQNLYINGVSFN